MKDMAMIRHDWTKEEIDEIYHRPLLELIYQAQTIHRQYHDPKKVQKCTLLSIKTGGCVEDCKYCPQSSRYQTNVAATKLMPVDEVVAIAKRAKENGSTRFCMGAAWRHARDSRDFESVIEMVKAINNMGMQVCVTLGMVTAELAQKLKEAGLYAYNHNLDTSREYYPEIITTRTYDDRLETIKNVQNAGITVCCGGILGLGEKDVDHVSMLHTLSTLQEHPESVPINTLVRVQGTPLAQQKRISFSSVARMIATARILMPKSMIRLSGGRMEMSVVEQALFFMAGANSIHTGEKLLTTQNHSYDDDEEMFKLLGLEAYSSEDAERQVDEHKAEMAARCCRGASDSSKDADCQMGDQEEKISSKCCQVAKSCCL